MEYYVTGVKDTNCAKKSQLIRRILLKSEGLPAGVAVVLGQVYRAQRQLSGISLYVDLPGKGQASG